MREELRLWIDFAVEVLLRTFDDLLRASANLLSHLLQALLTAAILGLGGAVGVAIFYYTLNLLEVPVQ